MIMVDDTEQQVLMHAKRLGIASASRLGFFRMGDEAECAGLVSKGTAWFNLSQSLRYRHGELQCCLCAVEICVCLCVYVHAVC